MNKFLRTKNTFIALGFLIALAFGLRFYNIDAHGLAGDEKYSLFVSQFVTIYGNNQFDSVLKPNNGYFTPTEFWSEKSFADFNDAIARTDNGNGALNSLLLHYWSKIFGVSDMSLRMPALLFNLGTILLLFFFVRRHFRSNLFALISVFLATIAPYFIAFSQVDRSYSLNIFLSLLATHLLLIILEKKNQPIAYYIAYGLCVFACLMCHFSVFPLFIIHGIYVLGYVRTLSIYLKLAAAMLIPLGGMLLWLNSDGGRWVFDFMKNSTKVYNYLASTQNDEYLKIFSLYNVARQIRHVVSAVFILIDGFPLLFVKFKPIYILIFLNFGLAYGSFIWQTLRSKATYQKQLRVLLLLFSIIPLLFLVVFAWQDGNTFRIIPRYVFYAYSYNILLSAFIIYEMLNAKHWIKYPFFAALTVQLLFILHLDYSIWIDKAPRYFMSYDEPRLPNPYHSLAQKIEKTYMLGDTIVYPSQKSNDVGGIDIPKRIVIDAQMCNFYLPKNALYLQRTDIKEPNKVYLKRANGEMLLLFDFEGNKYRY